MEVVSSIGLVVVVVVDDDVGLVVVVAEESVNIEIIQGSIKS